tara:strand:- start:280 stop:384 length:105 start_codon:yes stop_codon:yes gene_type:complete
MKKNFLLLAIIVGFIGIIIGGISIFSTINDILLP